MNVLIQNISTYVSLKIFLNRFIFNLDFVMVKQYLTNISLDKLLYFIWIC